MNFCSSCKKEYHGSYIFIFLTKNSQEKFDFERVNWKNSTRFIVIEIYSNKFLRFRRLDFEDWYCKDGLVISPMIRVVSANVSPFRLIMYLSLKFEILKIFHFYFQLEFQKKKFYENWNIILVI